MVQRKRQITQVSSVNVNIYIITTCNTVYMYSTLISCTLLSVHKLRYWGRYDKILRFTVISTRYPFLWRDDLMKER